MRSWGQAAALLPVPPASAELTSASPERRGPRYATALCLGVATAPRHHPSSPSHGPAHPVSPAGAAGRHWWPQLLLQHFCASGQSLSPRHRSPGLGRSGGAGQTRGFSTHDRLPCAPGGPQPLAVAHIPVRWQPWSRCRAPGRPRRALTLQRLQACDAAAQRAALLRSQAVPVLQAGEGAGVEQPLGGRCRAGAGFLCKAKRGRAEAAPAASRSRDGNLPRLGSLPAPPDPSACPIPRDCQQRTESCSVAVGMGPGMRAEVCRWPHRGAVPSAGGVQRSRHSRGQHLCQPGQLESLAQRGGSRRKQRVKSRGHLPGLCGCPAAGRQPQGSAGRQSSSPSIPRRVGHESHLWGTGDRRGEHRLRGAGS